MKLAANISLLYPGLPLAERISAAARDGFSAVEILFPYDVPHEDLCAHLHINKVDLVLINTPLGPMGEKGLASLPGREEEFEIGFRMSLAVCEATGCRTVHVMAGQLADGVSKDTHRSTLINNLKRIAPLAAKAGITLTLEALNRRDVPNYFYYTPDQVVDILECIDASHVRLQFDFYHTEVENLPLNNTLQRLLPWVHHVQFAHVNGRHEPDLQAQPTRAALRTLSAAGYAGWIGCEYIPRSDPSEGLVWRKQYWELINTDSEAQVLYKI